MVRRAKMKHVRALVKRRAQNFRETRETRDRRTKPVYDEAYANFASELIRLNA